MVLAWHPHLSLSDECAMPRLFRPMACLLLSLAGALPGLHAQALQPVQPIRDAALAAVQADASSQALVAPGLRLAACSQPLVATANSPTVADVRCPDTPGWRLFVPVRPATGPRMAATAEENPASAVMVKRGDPVILRASLGGGTEVRMGGRALGQARVGGTLNVENDSSHRIIRGRLAADGTVEVAN